MKNGNRKTIRRGVQETSSKTGKRNRENRTVKVHCAEDGSIKGKISFCCKALNVSREAFYDHLNRKADPWKYEPLASEMMKIHAEDEYNDCYGRERMYMALMRKKETGEISIDIPCEGTVRKVMEQI